MFGSPYSTTLGSKANLQKVELALQQADIKKQLRVIDPSKPWLVAVVEESDIPVFVHPVLLDDRNRGRKIVVDLRQYKRYINDLGDRIIIGAFGGAAISVNRAILQYHWAEDTALKIMDLSDLPLAIYGRWLSEQIIRGLSVEEVHQQRILVVCAYFYLSLFEKGDMLERRDAQKLASKVSQATGVTLSLVLEYIPDNMPANVPGLVALLSSGDYGMRLEHMNEGSFYTIVTKGFFGVVRPDEVLAIAVEYPPTFIALAYAMVNDRSYNQSPMQKAAKRSDRKDAFKQFNLAFDSFVGSKEG